MLAAGNVGTCIDPVPGGWIALASGSYMWVFWALYIFGGTMLVPMALVLPETARNVVGNGSIIDERWNQPICRLLQDSAGSQTDEESPRPSRSLKLTSPLEFLRLIFHKNTFLIIWIASSYYALWYCI